MQKLDTEAVCIRDASDADLNRMEVLVRENFLHHLHLDAEYYVDPDAVRESIQAEILRLLHAEEGKVLVADYENIGPVAVLTAEIENAPFFDTRIDRYGMIYELFVDKEFRKHGLGVKLLNAIETFFKQRGCNYVQLHASTFNKNAQDFYQRIGFEDRQRILIKRL